MARPTKDPVAVDAKEIEELKETVKAEETAPQTELTRAERAKSNARHLTPVKKFKPIGKLDPKWQKEHDYDWEYVEGVFENILSPGETTRFWFCKYPGDPDCYWEIPCNIPVSIPRMIAKHLETIDSYHKFTFVERPPMEWRSDDFTSTFQPLSKEFRSRFRPIGAFN